MQDLVSVSSSTPRLLL